MKNIFNLFYIVLLFSFPTSLSSQPTNTLVGDVVMPAPNAGSLGKYGDIPVSLYTGTPNISIPVYTVVDGSLSLPISLNYHSSGIRVSETASWAGIGWSLQAGGIITRTTQGIDDDKLLFGFYHDGGSEIDVDIRQYIKGDKDAEPDIYSFNVAGYSGKFFFDNNKKVHFVPKQDIRIETNLDGGQSGNFEQFTLISPDGTRYYFGQDPLETNRKAMEFSRSTGENPKTTASSWYLVRIESHDNKHTIKLLYEDEVYSYKSLANREYQEANFTNGDCLGINNGIKATSLPAFDANHHYVQTNIKGERLSQIISSSTTIDFNVNTNPDSVRQDLDYHTDGGGNTSKKLEEIEINSGAYCSKFKLNHTYYEDKVSAVGTNINEPFKKRLKLLSVQQTDCNNTAANTIPPYVFEYHDTIRAGVSFLPHRLNKGIDHWGFYNGADGTNNTVANNDVVGSFGNTLDFITNIPPTIVTYQGNSISYGSSYREPNFNYAKFGTLKKITYPTGGHTEFTFEANKYVGKISNGPSNNVIDLNNTDCISQNGNYGLEYCCGNYNLSDTSTFTSLDQIDDMHFRLYFGEGCTSIEYKASIDVYRVSDNAHIGYTELNEGNDGNAQVQWHQLSELQTINTFQAGTLYRFEFFIKNGSGIFTLQERPTADGPKEAGGLRIKQVLNHDGLSTVNDIIRTYEYINDNNEESGQLFYQPSYGLELDFLVACYGTTVGGGGTADPTPVQVGGALFFDQSYVPLGNFNGRHIAYSHIKESLNGNGYRTYKYNLNIDYPGFYQPTYPVAPVKYNPYNGKVENKKQFNQNNDLISETNTVGHGDPLLSGLSKTFYKFSRPLSIIPQNSDPLTNIEILTAATAVLYTPYRFETSVYRVAQVEETIDNVSTITSYDYDYVYDYDNDPDSDHYFPTSTNVTNSDQKTYTTHHEYVFDFSGAVYDTMTSRNMIATPIKTKVEVNGDTISGSYRICDFFKLDGTAGGIGDDPIYPKEFYSYEMTWNEDGSKNETGWDLQGTILEYDMTVGKPKGFQQNGWEAETYTWDATNKQIKTRQYQDFTWTYDYLANTRLLSKITDIDGQDTDFDYDQLMRLKTITARDGNVITTNDYHFSTGGNDKNYVKSRTEFPNNASLADSDLDWQESWQYLDGLGRPLQTVQRQHSTDEKDVITGAVRYDNQGRVVSQYEPYASTLNTGAFTPVPSGQDATFTVYYDSPLNRIHTVTPPGWFATTYEYGNNNTSIDIGGITYDPNSLYVATVRDPENLESISYTDKLGRTILSKSKKGSNETKTYTLYDDKGRINTILPPDVTSTVSALAYKYQYDGADNVLRKYIPDMGWSSFLYDTRNLPTASQDPKLASEGKWLCSIYDNYGRATNSGFYNENTASPPDGNTPIIHDLLSTTIYDGACGQTEAQYRGKVCQSRTRILNSNNWLESNLTYDEFGRMVATNGNSHANLIIGSEQSSVTYDWADNPLTTTRSHQAFNQSQFIVDRFTYDHVGRLENVYQRVNGGAEEWMSNQDYSVKDELIAKNLGGVGNSFLQQVDYTYKPNGFLTHINKDMSADDLFQFEINYETGNTTLAAVGQKNGNISQLTWQVKGQEKQTYGYQYDFLNRLSVANYGVYNPTLSPNNHYGTLYTYDSRGNIQSLQRQGFLPDNTFAQIDNLNYNYVANGSTSNRLLSIADNAPSASKAEGFKPGVGGDYGYDANGNMNYDPHKDMNIRYNHLNLPEFIEFPDCKAIEYSYDASGTKLKKTTKNGGAVISTQDYIGGIEYKNGVIEAIYNAEGRLYFENGTSRYEYNLSDHLGNNRVTFKDNGSGVAEIVQENHFYPFGLAMKGDFTQNAGRENKYLFNSKELDTDFGLNWYHYGARMYDPAIARWNSTDPLGEATPNWTPYRFSFNNPISVIDPIGLTEEYYNDGYGVTKGGSASVDGGITILENGNVPQSPIYGENGKFLGVDSEGFKGEIIIMNQYVHEKFSEGGMKTINHDFATSLADNTSVASRLIDANLSVEAWQNITTDILSKTEGVDIGKLYNHKTSVIDYVRGRKVNDPINFLSLANTDYELLVRTGEIKITTFLYGGNIDSEFSTVENIQNTLGAHEFIGHGVMKFRDDTKTHHKAYELQFKHSSYKGTTPEYKLSQIKKYKTYLSNGKK